MVAVQLLDRETAVQELGEQLSVSFTGTAMEREVLHPLALPAEQFSQSYTVFFVLKSVELKRSPATRIFMSPTLSLRNPLH